MTSFQPYDWQPDSNPIDPHDVAYELTGPGVFEPLRGDGTLPPNIII